MLVENDGSSGGTSSVLDVPEVASFSGEGGRLQFSTLQASNGGAISDGSLTSLSQVNLPLDSTASLDVAQITSYTGGTLTFSAGTLSLPVLADVDGSTFKISGGVTLTLPDVIGTTGFSFLVSGGAQVTLPALISYTGGLNYTDTLEATGAGSKLSLPVLAAIAGEPNDYSSWTQVEALAGGDIELPLLTKISGGPVLMESDGSSGGTDSLLDIPELASFSGEGGRSQFSTLQATHSGTVTDSSLGTFSNVNLVTDSTTTIAPTQTYTYTGGTNTIQAGTLLDQGNLVMSGTTGAITLNVQGGLTINGQGGLSVSSTSTLDVSGNLLGNTTNTSAFNPPATVILDSGAGTANPPQLLEAMSQDLGNISQRVQPTTLPTARSN